MTTCILQARFAAFTEGWSALLLGIIVRLIRHNACFAAFTEGWSALLLETIAPLIRHAARFVALTHERIQWTKSLILYPNRVGAESLKRTAFIVMLNGML